MNKHASHCVYPRLSFMKLNFMVCGIPIVCPVCQILPMYCTLFPFLLLVRSDRPCVSIDDIRSLIIQLSKCRLDDDSISRQYYYTFCQTEFYFFYFFIKERLEKHEIFITCVRKVFIFIVNAIQENFTRRSYNNLFMLGKKSSKINCLIWNKSCIFQ